MQKLFFRRNLRDFRDNALRYATLFFLMILALFIVVANVGSAYSIMSTVDKKGVENQLEDGQFSLFIPLRDREQKEIEEMGILLEPSFSLDFGLEDGSTLRLMTIRHKINRLEVDLGRVPKKDDEIVLEKIYASSHKISLDDSIVLADKEFKVVGIASTPDYELCIKNLSDAAADGEVFGTAFVTKEAYRDLLRNGKSLQTETYTYAYLLGDRGRHQTLKKYLKKLEISTSDVKDPFFQEMVEERLAPKKELTDALDELHKGTDKLYQSLVDLKKGTSVFYGKMESFKIALTPFGMLYDYYGGLFRGAEQIKDGIEELEQGGQEIKDGVYHLKKEATLFVDEYFPFKINNVQEFLEAKDNPRIKAAIDDVEINYKVGFVAGIVVMVLITYVISVFVIHSVEEESMQIGALYSLGVGRKELMIHYMLPPVAISFFGAVLGTILGYSPFGVFLIGGDTLEYFSTPALEISYHPWILAYGLLMPSLVAFCVTGMLIKKRLDRSALSLLREDQKVSLSKVKLKERGFVQTFRLRQLLREKRSCGAVLGGMFISLLILILGINCYVLCNDIPVRTMEDTRYEYMYHFKYPPKEPPKEAQNVFTKTLKRERFGYSLDITVMGINKKDNQFFPKITSKGKDKISISSSVAKKFNLSVGDELLLYDKVEERAYGFVIEEVVPYSVGLLCFMDDKSMKEVFQVPKDYYNTVYSSTKLSIPQGRLYGVNTRSDLERNSKIFSTNMMPMVITMVTVSILLFLIVMYQMTKVMVDRSSFSISLMKIFGYNAKEIGKLYLGANFILIAFGGLILLPLTKLFMDTVYPILVANVAMGVNLAWTVELYLGVYVGILVSFFLVRGVLLLRLEKTKPAEILKDRA